jgi:hypothetical protein
MSYRRFAIHTWSSIAEGSCLPCVPVFRGVSGDHRGAQIALQEHLLPEEYVQTMRRTMLDQCPVSSYSEVSRTITEELGSPPEALFALFEERPIASASLAQVSQDDILHQGGYPIF